MAFCRICGKASEAGVCPNCQYFLDSGSDEETLKRMLSNDIVKSIWKQNEQRAEDLGRAYYDSVLENYLPSAEDSKENFGFNTFVDGIRMGLDIILPLLDDAAQEMVIEKINGMVEFRNKANEKIRSKRKNNG